MGLIIENFKMAFSSVKANKMRTFLTMLGIIIGIASVIAITSVGDATNKTMSNFIKGLGENRTIIYMTFESEDFPEENEYFSFDDLDILKDKFPEQIVYAGPDATGQNTITKGNNEATVIRYPVDYNYMKELAPTTSIIYGRDFVKSDITGKKNFALVDRDFAVKLFKREDVVGETIDVRTNFENKTFTIIGVYKKEKTIFDNIGIGDSTFLAIPYTVDEDIFTQLTLKIANGYEPKKVTDKIRKYLARYKRVKENMYAMETLEEQAGQASSFLGTVSLGLGVIAGISLIVGGIGIMNIMLVSVTERTKEIGIRKSLGARKKDILMQFLVESVILSGAGGLIGTFLGLMLSRLISNYMNVDPTTPVKAVVIAVSFSFVVGIFFGIYPAYRASGLDPIDALRYE